jgi:cytochrome c-type biogenesis protein CcsB
VADAALATLSDRLLVATIVLYALSMLFFAADQASRRSRTVTARLEARESAAERTRVMAGAGGPTVVAPAPPAGVAPAPPAGGPPAGAGSSAAGGPPPEGGTSTPRSRRAGAVGLTLAGVGLAVHTGSVVARGLAVDRPPWGNMYEFSSAVALTAVAAFLVLVSRRSIDRGIGAFVMLPVVLYLGLAGTVLYTEAGPLAPALNNSYWLKLHVAGAILASGAFLLSGVVAVLYLVRDRYDAKVAAGRRTRFPLSMGASLPAARALDRATYAVIAFAFPIWTFAVIAGAIWAEAAWGRYWGWDPKETWSFITWVLYAGYLHARATAGWRGRKAAWVAVAAALALIIDYYVVNIFVVGLHSYGGLD